MKYLILFAILNFILSCSSDSGKNNKLNSINANDNVIKINIDKAVKTDIMKLSSIFDNVKLIHLDNSVLLGAISNMLVCGDSIFILDKKADKLFLYNKDGKFLNTYGGVGQGPGEYSQISDFTINKNEKLVYIIDPNTQKIIKYNFNGEYIETIRLDGSYVRSFNIQLVNDRLFCDAYFAESAKDNYLLREIDILTGEEKNCWMNISYNKGWNEMGFVTAGPFFTTCAGSSKYIPLFSDTIFSIDSSGIAPYIVIESKDLLTAMDIQNIDAKSPEKLTPFSISLFTTNKIYEMDNFVEFGDVFLFTYMQKNRNPWIFYNKKTKEVKIAMTVVDDVTYKAENNKHVTYPRILCADNKGLYGFIHSADISKFIQIRDDKYLNPDLYNNQYLNSITEDSNPILLYYEYKQK